MEAHPHTITQVFSDGGYVQYVLPHFQREYTWDVKDWKTLLEDTLAVYDEFDANGKPPEHFMGSLVRISNGARRGVTTFTLVDGQQRLTTISLMLCALQRLVPATNIDLRKQIGRMLVNPDEHTSSRYKLLPTTKHGDRAAYTAILDEETIPQSDSNIPLAFEMLHAELSEKLRTDQITDRKFFDTVMRCLQVVTIDLRVDERPYKIFESLNAKGKDLTPADLIRNYIAMTLPDTVQDEVFRTQWSYIDDALQEKHEVGSSGFGELTGFFRHYLAMRSETLYNKERVYERFRDRIERDFSSTDTFIAEIATLRRFASYYDKLLRPENESQPAIRSVLERLKIFEMSTAFPFLLRAYDAFSTNETSVSEFVDVLKILENFVVRRFLCGKQANYLNTMFPGLWKEIDHERFAESLREAIATKQYPTDQDVRQSVRTAKKYAGSNLARLGLIFDAVNRKLSEGTGAITIPDAAPTIEHIMPQSTPTEAWKTEIGEDWQEIHEQYRHTLGNLTLVTQAWNSSLSNDPFAIKKRKLAENGLRINSVYFANQLDGWSEGAIIIRADWLADKILEIWPALSSNAKALSSTSKPKAVIILGDRFTVSKWTDILFHVADSVAELVGDAFPEYAAEFPRLFTTEAPSPNHEPRKLSNGWWLSAYWGPANIVKYSRQLLTHAGLSESDLEIEE